MRSKEDIIKALNFSVKHDVMLTLSSEDAATILWMIDEVPDDDADDADEEEEDDDSIELYAAKWL